MSDETEDEADFDGEAEIAEKLAAIAHPEKFIIEPGQMTDSEIAADQEPNISTD